MKSLCKQSLLLLTAALLMLPLWAPTAQAAGCPGQFQACSTRCKCNTPCITPCCNGAEAKLCLEVLCQSSPQCGFSVAAAPVLTPLLAVETEGCAAPADGLELTLEDALQAPSEPAEPVAEAPQAS